MEMCMLLLNSLPTLLRSAALPKDYIEVLLFLQGTGNGGFRYIVQTVLLPIVLAVTLLQLVVKNGKKWVDKPQLCPDMSQPW